MNPATGHKEEQKQNLIDMMQDDEKLGLYQSETMTDQDKTNLLFKIWLNSGMTKTDFAIKCGWKNSSNFCRMVSGKSKTTYEHLEIACRVTNRNFKIEIL